MSIKTKLTLMMTVSVLIILLLNITLTYYTTQENLRRDSENKMKAVAEQIVYSIEQSNYSSNYVERQISEVLRLTAIMAAKELDPDINNITNEQLVALSKELGVSHISLLVQTEDNIIVAKSSDPREIGMPTKDWGFWYTAFLELFDKHQVTISQGWKADHFWSGPFEYSSSSPNYIDKWGYYHDGKRNYIIDPYIRSTAINDYVKVMNHDELIEHTLEINPQILEITGINPETFGYGTMSNSGYDRYHVKLRNRPIRFGTYHYGDISQDKQAISEAVATNESVTYKGKIKNKAVLKSFIPIQNVSNKPLVIGVVMDYASISSVGREQLINHISISLILLAIVIVGSYILASYITRPLHSILKKVNDVSEGRFHTPLISKSNDEIGLLIDRINSMTRNLDQNTRQLKQTIEENRSVKEHLESVINQTADSIHMTDLCDRVIQVNKAFEQLYGWKNEEVTGKQLQLVPDFLKNEEAERQLQILKGYKLPPTETIRLKKDGSTVEVSISTSPIRDKEGNIISLISISRDMTERNRMEELLRRSEKLTTVGQLAAGVAHEIRNPLTTLRGFIQLQKEQKKLNQQHIEIMLSELDRINLIVSEFLILSKPQAVKFQEKDVRLIVQDVVAILDSQANLHGIEFTFRSMSEPALVHCEENQLKQVFINILKNAIEAMQQGGTISLELYKRDSRNLVLSITDQGVGIPEEMMSKLGEPFFSNKESGTGLGLMVSQRIIQSHKGMMEVESTLGQGTKVSIILPLASN